MWQTAGKLIIAQQCWTLFQFLLLRFKYLSIFYQLQSALFSSLLQLHQWLHRKWGPTNSASAHIVLTNIVSWTMLPQSSTVPQSTGYRVNLELWHLTDRCCTQCRKPMWSHPNPTLTSFSRKVRYIDFLPLRIAAAATASDEWNVDDESSNNHHHNHAKAIPYARWLFFSLFLSFLAAATHFGKVHTSQPASRVKSMVIHLNGHRQRSK